jgi:probable F420-dependent oxidoreductase
MNVEFAVQLANMEPALFRANAQAAEELGYDMVLFPDHLVLEGPERQYDPQALAYDSIAVAAALIEATKTIRIGHLVLCNLFRHPAITAQSLMTLDHFSGGRLVAGLGTGWTKTEFDMMGIAFPPIAERLKMLDESLECIISLWTNERTSFAGEFYELTDAILWPKPVQQPRPPIILGGSGTGLLRLAAKYADYINIIPAAGKLGHISLETVRQMTDESFSKRVRFVREEAKRLGRDPETIKGSNFIFNAMLTDSPAETRKAAETVGQMLGQSAEMVLESPMSLIGTHEECVTELKRRVENWGVSHFVLSAFTPVDEEKLRAWKEGVFSHV